VEVAHALVERRHHLVGGAVVQPPRRERVVRVDPPAVRAVDGDPLVVVARLEVAAAVDAVALDRERLDPRVLVERSGLYRVDDRPPGVAEAVAVVGLAHELAAEFVEVVVELRAVAHADRLPQVREAHRPLLGLPEGFQDGQARLVADDGERLRRRHTVLAVLEVGFAGFARFAHTFANSSQRLKR